MSKLKEGLIACGVVFFSALLIFAMGFAVGGIQARDATKLKAATAQVVAVQDAREEEHKAAAVSQAIGVATATKAQKTRTVTQEVIKYVPQYLPADSRLLSDGFVRLHDAAASGDASGLADAAGGMDGALSGVTEAEALPVIAANYGECNLAIDRANAWIDWAAAQHVIRERKGGD